jgi:hypothetical protein
VTYLDGAHLTEDQRTEDLLDENSSDVTHLCGCMFWRESAKSNGSDFRNSIRVRWCARHTPFYMLEDDPTPEETPT